MKRIFEFILVILLALNCHAQTVYSGRVLYQGIRDAGSNVQLSDCVIVCSNDWCFYSDIPGATISLKNCLLVGQGFFADKAASVTLENCHIEAQGQAGIIVQNTGPTNEWVWIANTDINEAWTAIQLSNVQNDPNVWILSPRITQSTNYAHNDQISVYQSSGTPEHRIEINHGLVVCDPDAPQVLWAAGIVAGDTGSSYVQVINTIVLNGQVGGINAYKNGSTSLFTGNTILGVGAPTGWSAGFGVSKESGQAYSNTIGWWDSYYQVLRNLAAPVNGQNWELPANQITLAYEQQLIAQWATETSNQGYLYWPTPQLPGSWEFPK